MMETAFFVGSVLRLCKYDAWPAEKNSGSLLRQHSKMLEKRWQQIQLRFERQPVKRRL
jgi:hypothetical protein